MKNLYLTILLLAYATNLSAFDKVWELQFSSTPHHVHYTEGHKELIVGEGNTFKKYNAETGVLIDSVVYNLEVLKDYTVGEYHVTDDLKSLYVYGSDSQGNNILKFDIQSNSINKKIVTVNYTQGEIHSGKLYQVSDNYLILATQSREYDSGPPNSNFTIGTVFVITKDTCLEYYYFATNYLYYNSINHSFVVDGSNYHFPYRGKPEYTYYSRYANIVNTKLSKEIVKLNGVLSKNDKYIYSVQYIPGYIYKYDFSSLENRILKVTFKNIWPFKSDDEMILGNKGKIYHYNFKVNSYLDSINLGNNNSFLTDLNNNYLLSIDTNKIAAYKSSANPNKVISYLKDTLVTKSVGDTITLNAISNLNPVKEEWDLGDGRTLYGDTIKFAYSKKGEYLVKYTGTYQDTVVYLTCKVKVIDTLAISLFHKVEMKQGYTQLTLNSDVSGEYSKISYSIKPNKGKSSLAYELIDISLNNYTYKIYTSDIYKFEISIWNSIDTVSKSIELAIPVNNIKNTDYSLLNMLNITNIVSFNENIYFQSIDYQYSFWMKNPNSNGNVYEIEFLSKFNLLDSDYTTKLIANSKRIEHYSIDPYEIESYSKKYATNKIFLSNNSLVFCSENIDALIKQYSNTLYLVKDTMTLLQNHSVNVRGISNLSYTKYKNKYLLNTTNSNNNFYLVDTVDFKGNQYNGKNLNLFTNASFSVIDTNIHMIAHNKNICIYKLNSDFDILDTIATFPYLRSYSRAINGKYAYSLIDSSKNSNNKQLVSINIEKKKSFGFNLNNTINYHQVFQLKKDVSCLVGTKNDELIIQAFKDGETAFTDFVIPVNIPLNIVGMTKDNELHLNYTASGTISSYIRTKGFADIFKSLASSSPDDSTSNPIDTTKNKGIIQNKDNQFGSVIQDQDFKTAKIYFKDSLDLSNSFVKIYTETGDEILTYSLSKDQKELLIRTDKLYLGIYYVRLLNKGEEYNLGKFIIVR